MESGRNRGEYTVRIFGRRWGFERSPIVHDSQLYMDRWILYLAGYTLRLHKICRPDNLRGCEPHNHPFTWFITFPLGTYSEMYWVGPDEWPPVPEWLRERQKDGGWVEFERDVKAFRFHFRDHTFRHYINGLWNDRPVWTIVVTGPYLQQWGFFPTPLTFRPFKPKQGTTNEAP